MHGAVKEELTMLRERFPGKCELDLGLYAEYFGIRRQYAPQHFRNLNQGPVKINHKRIGRKIIIPMLDFAYWLAQQKVVDGKPLNLQPVSATDMKRRRGFAKSAERDYRSTG